MHTLYAVSFIVYVSNCMCDWFHVWATLQVGLMQQPPYKRTWCFKNFQQDFTGTGNVVSSWELAGRLAGGDGCGWFDANLVAAG